MSINLDLSKIQAYSTALSSKLCNTFFSDKQVIHGAQILSFTPVQQVNLFIVKILFDKWKEELQKLKSPYFNYETTEVKEALTTFMNTLSKNISVTRESYSPLVQKAISETLVVCLSPTGYLQQEYTETTTVAKAALLDKLKYHKVHASVFKKFQEQVENSTRAEWTKEELEKLIASLPLSTVEEETKAQEALTNLSALLSFDIKDFNPQALKTSFQQEASSINKPFGEESKSEVLSTFVPADKKPIEKNTPVQKQLTINDSLKTAQESSIADRFSKSKIEDIKSSIPLNLKFLFINILFDGNSVDYATALNEIEQAESIEKVRDLLHRNYSEKYKWANHSEEADEFLKIIERKFY